MVPCTLLKSLIAGNSIYSKTLETSSPSNLPLTHHPLPSFPPCLTPHNTPQHTPTTRRALKLEWAAASYKHARQTYTTHRPHRREAKEESKVPLYIYVYIYNGACAAARDAIHRLFLSLAPLAPRGDSPLCAYSTHASRITLSRCARSHRPHCARHLSRGTDLRVDIYIYIGGSLGLRGEVQG